MFTRLWDPWLCACGEWQVDAILGDERLDVVTELIYEAIADHQASECALRHERPTHPPP